MSILRSASIPPRLIWRIIVAVIRAILEVLANRENPKKGK